MTTIKITVKNEMGKEVNPYIKPRLLENSGNTSLDEINKEGYDENIKEYNKLYSGFEQSVITYDAPGIPDTKEGESAECELVWQAKRQNNNEWFMIDSDDMDFHSEFGRSFRKIYKLL